MYKLFAAAQAIEFSVGCHAKCSNFVVKSKELPFASTPSAPRLTTRVILVPSDLEGLEGVGTCRLIGFLLASKVVASALPGAQPNTRNKLLVSSEPN